MVVSLGNTSATSPLISENDKRKVQFVIQALNNNDDMNSPYVNSPLNLMLYERKSSRIRNSSLTSMVSASDDEIGGTWSTSFQARATLVSILSVLYAVVLVIVALAFEVSILVVNEVESHKYDPFYIYLYIGGLLFLAYCHIYLLRSSGWKFPLPFYRSPPTTPRQMSLLKLCEKKTYVSHAAKDAGSLYLRLGAIVFGVVGIMDRGINIYISLDNGFFSMCYDSLHLVEDCLFIVFLFVQLYFIFQNSRLIIHRLKHFGRFGFMHLVATNLCIWIRRIVTEEFSVIKQLEQNIQHAERANRSSAHAQSLLLNIMPHERILPSIESSIDCNKVKNALDLLLANAKPFLATCTVEYAIICAAIMYILWRNVGKEYDEKFIIRKERLQIDCGSSTKGLFVGLMFVMFSLLSMVVFFTKIQREENGEALWVMYMSDFILYSVSIVAVVCSFYLMRNLTYMPSKERGVLLDDILLLVSLVGQLMFCIFSVVALTNWQWTSWMIIGVSSLRMIQVLVQTVFILTAQRLVCWTPLAQLHKPGREIITFLLLCNLAMFLINTFETQKSGVNPIMVDFYGKSIWSVIMHSTVPLTIFYRFHSSVCLAEIWKTTYQMKEQTDMM